jgi:hypothetical protein
MTTGLGGVQRRARNFLRETFIHVSLRVIYTLANVRLKKVGLLFLAAHKNVFLSELPPSMERV